MEFSASSKHGDDTLEALRIIATDFRNALEQIRENWEQLLEERETMRGEFEENFCSFASFPESCCDKTSRILTRYLFERGYEQSLRINSYWVGGGAGHEWVLVDNIIVDITADQMEFIKPCPCPVIVTSDHSWHHQYFENFTQYEYKPGWNNWGEYPPALLDQLYELVIEHLPKRY